MEVLVAGETRVDRLHEPAGREIARDEKAAGQSDALTGQGRVQSEADLAEARAVGLVSRRAAEGRFEKDRPEIMRVVKERQSREIIAARTVIMKMGRLCMGENIPVGWRDFYSNNRISSCANCYLGRT